MAQIPGGGFNADDHGEMRSSLGVLPSGDYHMHIVASQMKETKDKTGEFLEIEMDILTPEFSGRKLWVRLNLNNRSAQAVEIANNELAAICHAVGRPVISDSVELHLLPFIGSVDLEEGREAVAATATTPALRAYPPRNKLTGYSPAAGGPAAAGAAKPTPPAAAAPVPPAAAPPAAPEAPAAATAPAAAEAPAPEGNKPPWA